MGFDIEYYVSMPGISNLSFLVSDVFLVLGAFFILDMKILFMIKSKKNNMTEKEYHDFRVKENKQKNLL
jgi:hypothetical protein